MSIKSVLIIGGSGFVGTHLTRHLGEGYKVFATYSSHSMSFTNLRGVTFLPLDIENRSWIKRTIQTAKPDVILYLLGDYHREASGMMSFADMENLHSKGIANVLSSAEMIQPKLIYLSTCHVFDGERGNYHEGEAAIPDSLLGKSMISAENLIRSRALQSVIIRSSPLLGRGNGTRLSFLDRLRMQLDRGKSVELAENEIHSFAPVEGLTELVSEAIEKPGVRNKILHYGGLTKLSTADFGRAFAGRFGYDPKKITSRVVAHRTEKKEISDYSLNSSQTIELLKIKPLLLEESFDLIEKNLIARA